MLCAFIVETLFHSCQFEGSLYDCLWREDKVLNKELFPQHTIPDLNCGITFIFIVLFSQEKSLRWKEINTHTQTQHTHKNSKIYQLKLTKIYVNFKLVIRLADLLLLWKIKQRKKTDTKSSIMVLEKPLNLPLVSCYLHTQYGHLSTVHELIFNLNISNEEEILISNENFLPKFLSFIV